MFHTEVQHRPMREEINNLFFERVQPHNGRIYAIGSAQSQLIQKLHIHTHFINRTPNPKVQRLAHTVTRLEDKLDKLIRVMGQTTQAPSRDPADIPSTSAGVGGRDNSAPLQVPPVIRLNSDPAASPSTSTGAIGGDNIPPSYDRPVVCLKINLPSQVTRSG